MWGLGFGDLEFRVWGVGLGFWGCIGLYRGI